MGNIPSLFGGKTNTTTQNQTQQAGSTTNPLANLNFQYAQGNVFPQFSSGNIANTAAGLGANQFQTGAASNQAALAQSAMPAFGAASSMAQNGISPSAIQQWMSPYTQNVIDATNRQADINDGRTLTQAQGSNALTGGLTNSAVRGNMDYLRANLANNRNAMAANQYNTGYNTAAGNAFQNAALQNTAANTVSGMLGAQTGANAALGGLGQNLYGVSQYQAMVPYNLTAQGAQVATGMVPGVGSSYSGTGTGNSTGTSQQNPGLIQSLMGLGGLGLAGYDYGSQKGWFADGGAVEAMPRFRENDQVEKLADTFRGLKGMLTGGSVFPKYDAGGWVPVVEKAPTEPSAEASFASRLSGLTNAFQPYNGSDQIAQSQKALTEFMGRMPMQNALPKFADGGSTIRPMSPEAQFGAALLAGSPIAGTGDAMLKMQQQRIQEEQNKRQFGLDVGRTMGEYNGAQTLGMREFREKQYQNDLPQIRPVDVNPDTGQPVYAWTSPQQSPLFRPRNETAPPVNRQGVMAPTVPVPYAGAPTTQPMPGIAPITAPNGLASMNAQTTDMTGEEFAKWLESQGRKPYADKLRAIAEGRERFPENPRTPVERQLQNDAMKYDPTIDGTNYQVRAATLKDFNAGPTSKNIVALNTAARHAADLYHAIDNLGTSDVWGGNAARKMLMPFYAEDPKYKPKLNDFEVAKLALAEEASKAFHGGPSVSGVEEWKKTMEAADSPAALRASAAKLIKLLEGRVQEIEGNYFRAMGKNPKRSVLSPNAKEEYELVKKAAAQNLPIDEMRKRMGNASEPAQRGAVNGPASGPSVEKQVVDRLPGSRIDAMSLDQLRAVNPKTLTQKELLQAKKRFDELSKQ